MAPVYRYARDLSYPLIRAAGGGTMLVHGIEKLVGPPIGTLG